MGILLLNQGIIIGNGIGGVFLTEMSMGCLIQVQTYIDLSAKLQKLMQKDAVPVDIHGPFFVELINRGNSISPRVVNFLTSFAQLIREGDTKSPLFSFTSWKYPISYPTASPLCSKSIANTQTKKAFRCYDCMEINTALLCYDCFVNSNHKGHTFLEYESSGGCCDCGDSSLWNENGFCPAHTRKENKVNIPQGLKDLFVGEMKMVYYLYFWCVDKASEFHEVLALFGDALFDYAGKIIQANHETKVMMAELLSSSLYEFPPLQSAKGSILASVFHLPAMMPVLQKVRKFAFDMYPVEQFRASVLKEYFQLTRSGTFTWQHAIRKFNFQYLTCVRMVITLIKQKKMLPLQIDGNKLPKETNNLVSVFKKYYEDLNYLGKMKDGKQYFEYHFELTHAIDMGLYRPFSSITKKQIFFLDEYYLKTLGNNLEYILTRKDLIVRNMKELFNFVLSWKEMTCSLAQERGFAMFVVAYLEGDMMKLRNEQVVTELLSVLEVKEQDAGVVLSGLVAKNLRNIAILSSYSHIKPQKNSYQNYFYSAFPQKDFILHLDHIYQKTLFLLGKNRLNYWQIVKCTMEEIIFQGEGTKIQNEPQHNEPSALKREEYASIIADLSIFFAKLFMQDLNEIVICNLLCFPRDEQIRQLYLKLISAYANRFTVKQIKLLSSYLVNNPQLFDSTLKEHTVYQNGRLKILFPVEPIEKFIYADSLRGYRNFDELKWECVESIPTVPVLQGERIREDVVELMVDNAKRMMSKIQKQGISNNLKPLEGQVLALLQIFLLTQDPQIKSYFFLSIQTLKQYLHSDVSTHINFICKQRQLLFSQQQQGERQKQDDLRRKRERVQLKRKEKQAMMRKNQEMMLKQYNNIEEETEQKETCIYCKEDIKQDYHLLSYVNLTNLIPKCVLKQNKLHAFISTCGHKVHQQCYTKYGEEQQRLSRCFLCKKKSNIILPSLNVAPINDEEEGYAIAGKFLDSIFASLVAECEEKQAIFRMFLQDDEGEGNVLRAILKSIAKEAIYYGLHLFQPYRKYSLHAYQLVYGVIRFARKDELAISLIRLQLEDLDNCHPLAILERYAYYFLRRELLGEENEDPNLPHFDPILLVELQKIISLIANPNQVPSVNPIQVITQQSLMRALPESISQLHQSIGQCPFCKKLTNWIYYCVLCDWRGCNKETKTFLKHSREDHLEGSIFISAGNGKTSVVCNGLVKNQESVYENLYGESYVHNDQNTKKANLPSFKLNFGKYRKFYEQIMTHSLHNIIQ